MIKDEVVGGSAGACTCKPGYADMRANDRARSSACWATPDTVHVHTQHLSPTAHVSGDVMLGEMLSVHVNICNDTETDTTVSSQKCCRVKCCRICLRCGEYA